VISGSLSEVVVEHATQSLSPANRPTINSVTGIRDDQSIIEALVVAFTMIMAQKFTNTSACPVKAGVFSGSQPRQGKSRSPVAWMVGRRETELRKSIDKAVLGTVSESSGRNEGEGTGGPENVNLSFATPHCD